MNYLIFFLTFSAYLFTLFPSLPPRDSAEFITASGILGVPHPPGYPLYVLLGKIFTIIIPFGNIAYRVNIMSAVFGALSCCVVYKIVLSSKSEGHWTAFVTTLILGFSKTFWSQSVVSEVFTLNAFFVVLIVYLLLTNSTLKGATTPLVTRYSLLAFLFGLGLGNHHTLVLLVPGIVYLAVSNQRSADSGKDSCILTTTCHLLPATCYLLSAFILGFSIYLYLPIRSAQNPYLNWGEPSSFTNFLNVILRKEYGTLKLTKVEPASPFIGIFVYLKALYNDFTLAGFLLAIIGIFAVKKEYKIFTLILFLFTGPFVIGLARLPDNIEMNAVIERFYYLPTIIFVIWVGLGLQFIMTQFKKIDSASAIVKVLANGNLIITLFLVWIIFWTVSNYYYVNKRKNYYACDIGRNILISVFPRSPVLIGGDTPAFVLWYLQQVEKKFPEKKVICDVLVSQWGLKQLKRNFSELKFPKGERFEKTEFLKGFIQENSGSNAIFIVGDVGIKKFGINKFPFGLIDIVSSNRTPVRGEHLFGVNTCSGRTLVRDTRENLWEFYFYRGNYEVKNYDYFSQEIIKQYSVGHNRSGIEYLSEGKFNLAIKHFSESLKIDPDYSEGYNSMGSVYFNKRDYFKAIEYFKRAVELKSDNIEAQNNLGSAYATVGKYDEAERAFETALKLDPNNPLAKSNLENLKNIIKHKN